MKTVSILMAGVDDLAGRDDWVRELLPHLEQRPYFFPQISTNPLAKSLLHSFKWFPLSPSRREVMSTPEELEA